MNRLILILLFPLFTLAQLAPITVPNMAALRTITPTGKPVFVEGYYAPGDGGGGWYSQTNTTSGTNAYGGRVLALGGTKSWQLVAEEASALQYGAKGDGSTDDTVALNALLSSSHASLLIPKGSFKKTARLNLNRSNVKIRWLGYVFDGPGINYHSTLFGAPPTITNGVLYPSIGNITIDGEGSGVLDGNSLNAVEYFTTNGAALYGGHGLYFANASNIVVTGMSVSNCPTFAVAFYGCEWIKISNCNVDNGNGNNSANFNGKNADGYHFTDCRNVQVINCTGRSTDDTFPITAIDANCENFLFSNVRARHSLLPTGTTYQPLGYCARVSLELVANTNYARISNVEYNNFVFTGGNGAMTLQSVSPNDTCYVSNVRFVNGIVSDFPAGVVTGTYSAKFVSIVDGVKNLLFENVTWTNINRSIYLQTVDGITFSKNQFFNWTYNANIGGTYGAITYDAVNGPVSSVVVQGSLFDGISQQAINLNGSSGGNNYLGEVVVSGNQFQNGGQVITSATTTGYAAVRVSGSTNSVVFSDNRFRNWEGTPIDVLNGNVVRIFGNSMFPGHTYSTNSQGITVNATTGTLIPVVDISGNYVSGTASTGIFAQNFERINLAGNVSVGNNVLDSNQAGVLVQVIQSGSSPSVSNVSGQVINNFFQGTTTTGLRIAFSSTNLFTGTPITVANNTILGFSTKISRDTSGISQDRVYLLDPLVVGSTAGSAASQTYLRYNVSQTTDDDSVLFVERIFSGAGASSTAQNSLNVIHRYQGSGGNTSILTGASVVMSHDQTANAALLRGISSLTRLTSTGTATEAQAISAQIQHSGGGVVTNANTFVVYSPSLSGGSTIGTAAGVTILPQAGSGITNGYAILQSGASDINSFAGNILLGGSQRFSEIADPSAPAANTGLLYVRDNGSGKSQLVIRFPSGAVQVIATEP